ncbi:hypothetical protein NBEOAGPD_2266 [Methylobacterium gregans]|uniref:Uncharacterized protein n=1 Tax=Methylobacterium gregans TaxID=374424 RepID=A0AA37HP38_9HYPH|nr:hypothetical protein NBEOAGPD_2266 [Methylobacterium gregans]
MHDVQRSSIGPRHAPRAHRNPGTGIGDSTVTGLLPALRPLRDRQPAARPRVAARSPARGHTRPGGHQPRGGLHPVRRRYPGTDAGTHPLVPGRARSVRARARPSWPASRPGHLRRDLPRGRTPAAGGGRRALPRTGRRRRGGCTDRPNRLAPAPALRRGERRHRSARPSRARCLRWWGYDGERGDEPLVGRGGAGIAQCGGLRARALAGRAAALPRRSAQLGAGLLARRGLR